MFPTQNHLHLLVKKLIKISGNDVCVAGWVRDLSSTEPAACSPSHWYAAASMMLTLLLSLLIVSLVKKRRNVSGVTVNCYDETFHRVIWLQG